MATYENHHINTHSDSFYSAFVAGCGYPGIPGSRNMDCRFTGDPKGPNSVNSELIVAVEKLLFVS